MDLGKQRAGGLLVRPGIFGRVHECDCMPDQHGVANMVRRGDLRQPGMEVRHRQLYVAGVTAAVTADATVSTVTTVATPATTVTADEVRGRGMR